MIVKLAIGVEELVLEMMNSTDFLVTFLDMTSMSSEHADQNNEEMGGCLETSNVMMAM